MDEGVGSPTITWHAAEAFAAEVEVERARWMAISALVESLTDNERRAPGYFRDPDWSVKDLVAHLTAWMAEARVQLLDIAARSYVPHEIAVDARNARILELSKAQTWDETWAAANAARAWMLEARFELAEPSDAASYWVRKAGAEHYGEHLTRLRDWVAELLALRTRAVVDEGEG